MSDYLRNTPRIGPVDGVYFDDHGEYLKAYRAKESQAFQVFREFLEDNNDLLSCVARQGDGECGSLIQVLKDSLLGTEVEQDRRYRKKKIGAALRTSVFERDMYRCKRCGDHRELCADHVYPESLGGATTFENLQTLCRTCNASKGAKVEAAA